MAHVELHIRREDASTIRAEGEIPDELLLDVTSMLGAVLFDVLCTPPETSKEG